MRITKDNMNKILENNDGFEDRTYYEGSNSREERFYSIKNGKLNIRAIGKSSWADSRYDKTWIADEEETHRFLYKHKDELNIEDDK